MEEEKKKNKDEWALAFGDMITLLMTFFVLIISMSTIKMDDITEKINKNVGYGDNLIMAELRETGMYKEDIMSILKLKTKKDELPPPAPVKDLELLRDEMVIFVTENKLARVIDLGKTKEGFSIGISADILFDPGGAILKKEYLFLLNNIADLLDTVENDVRIDGHTDDSNTDEYYNNKLSIARATSVCSYIMVEGMLEPARFAVSGHGSYRSLLPNNSEKNRAKNRRVEITIKAIQKNG